MVKMDKGSGNVFADLGYRDAETHKVKAGLVRRIEKLIDARGLTQVEAADILGMSQPDVSKMLRGMFRTMTIDRLMDCLLALGEDVEIIAKTPKRSSAAPKRGKLTVVAA